MEHQKDVQDYIKEVRTEKVLPWGSKERVELYEKWADQYEEMTTRNWETKSALNVVQSTIELLGENRDVKILDAGAGTGRLGEKLHEKGFRNLDALDGCSAMLEEAKKKDIYSRFICDFLGPNKLDVPDATYDCITAAGMFAPNHANDGCFEEIIRILKSGAYFVFNLNENYLDFPEFKDRFQPRIQMLSDQGLWKVISCDRREYTRKLNEEWTMSLLYCVQKL